MRGISSNAPDTLIYNSEEGMLATLVKNIVTTAALCTPQLCDAKLRCWSVCIAFV